MPRDKRHPSPYERAGSDAINATVARVAPAVLGLLADGVPRSRPAIVEALAGRHARDHDYSEGIDRHYGVSPYWGDTSGG